MQLLHWSRALDWHLGRPLTRGALSLFPVWNGRAVTAPGYALQTAPLAVAERSGAPVVGELVVTNAGPLPALVTEGELLEGGHQHRVAARTVLVPARGSAVLDVHCVERGRWRPDETCGDAHARAGRRAPLRVRARATEGQSEVWAEVARLERQHGAGATSSLLDATRSAEAQAARLVAATAPLPGQCGVLVAVAGQPLAVEVFDAPEALAQAWAPLLRAAAVDAAGWPAAATPGRRARRFLDRVLRARGTGRRPAGLAVETAAESPCVVARTVTWGGRAVHAVAVNRRHGLVAA